MDIDSLVTEIEAIDGGKNTGGGKKKNKKKQQPNPGEESVDSSVRAETEASDLSQTNHQENMGEDIDDADFDQELESFQLKISRATSRSTKLKPNIDQSWIIKLRR